jgi:hypothetical protein
MEDPDDPPLHGTMGILAYDDLDQDQARYMVQWGIRLLHYDTCGGASLSVQFGPVSRHQHAALSFVAFKRRCCNSLIVKKPG